MKILEKTLGSRFSVSGIEKLPQNPVLFVANHFTRSETFFVPYIIHKNTGRQVRCLADSSLYHGILGKFLNSVGTISTKDSNRDNIIIKDLVTGNYDWMIYPEGSMIKSKEIRHEKNFVNYTPSRVGPVRTGSAVLALKSEIYRKNIITAYQNKDKEFLKNIKKTFEIEYEDSLSNLNTYIVPLNITYYPIRPGINKIEKLINRLVKKIPKQVLEELEIEGNLLLNSEINIHFGEPINISDQIAKTKKMIDLIPIIKEETKANLLLKYFKHRLTNDFMEKIYSDLQINLDHIFIASLKFISDQIIDINHLKRIIYFSAVMIGKLRKYRLHPSIFEDNLFKIFIDEKHDQFDSIFELARNQKIISVEGDKIYIDKERIEQKFDFHQIRLENTLQVVLNEFLLLEDALAVVSRNSKISDDQLKTKVFYEIYQQDLNQFESDYQIYFDKNFSKDKKVGTPFFFDHKDEENLSSEKIGILICHGYKSAPMEVKALGEFLNKSGYKTYGVRLAGHGTAPINLKETNWLDWYNSAQRGYAALKNICDKIFLIGFSTGGLISLLSSANKSDKISGVISINSALKLMDIKAKMVPGINIWNELLEKLHIEKYLLEYVDDKPENPQINYSRNYLKAVEQLQKLMLFCEDRLKEINCPALIIQGKKDPVVNPVSGKIIFEKINSQKKYLSELDFSNHVIINGDNKEEVFKIILNFIKSLA
jgi:esterase/lipase/1-acyl-sn-glycerol-3-phosphate acyltransferase